MKTRRQQLRVALLAALTFGAATLLFGAGPAHADVDSVAGSAFGASITSTLLGTVLAPSPPNISGSATEPTDGYGPISASNCPLPVATTICVQLPGVVSLGVINASTQGAGVAGDSHLGFATSSASVANVAVGALGTGLFATAVSSTCTADGNGARGSTQVLNGTLNGTPLVQAPAAGTTLSVPGILTVVLNEQLPIPPATSINSVGSAGIIVNGAHITVLPNIIGTGTVDIILAQSRCQAIGPDVNVVQTTTSTTAPSTTTTTTAATTTTTAPTATTTTTAPGTATTTTTAPTAATTTTAAVVAGTTTTTGLTAIIVTQQGLLARTGARIGPVALLAFALTVLGGLFYFGGHGLPDPSAQRFGPMLRSTSLPSSRAPRLDEAARDALASMEEGDDDAGPPPAAPGWIARRRGFGKRPW